MSSLKIARPFEPNTMWQFGHRVRNCIANGDIGGDLAH